MYLFLSINDLVFATIIGLLRNAQNSKENKVWSLKTVSFIRFNNNPRPFNTDPPSQSVISTAIPFIPYNYSVTRIPSYEWSSSFSEEYSDVKHFEN